MTETESALHYELASCVAILAAHWDQLTDDERKEVERARAILAKARGETA